MSFLFLLFFSQPAILDLCRKDVLISYRHLNGNHWTGVAISNRSKEVFFLDSARVPVDARLSAAHTQEQIRAVERFNKWAKRWDECHDANHQFGCHFQRVPVEVQQQQDGNTCGIWSMVVCESLSCGNNPPSSLIITNRSSFAVFETTSAMPAAERHRYLQGRACTCRGYFARV